MTNQTTEKAFETYVEQILLAKGWRQGLVSGWDRERALFSQAITALITAAVTGKIDVRGHRHSRACGSPEEAL